jgi:hypothetical protein
MGDSAIPIVSLAVLAAAIAVWWWRRRQSGPWGFREVLKHPGYWDDAAEHLEQTQREIAAAADWGDEQVAEAVEAYLFDAPSSQDAWTLHRSLQELGERTHPHVVRWLLDESVRQKLVTPTGTVFGIVPESPFGRACNLIQENPPASLAPVMADFLNETETEIREDAARVVGELASPETLPAVKQALADPQRRVVARALDGVGAAAERGGLDDECRDELFHQVQQFVGKHKHSRGAAGALLALDRDRAAEFLTSDEVLAKDSLEVRDVLEQLGAAGVHISRERLLNIINRDRREEISKIDGRVIGTALKLLGQQGSLRDEPLLMSWSEHSSEYAATGATEGLLALHGLPAFEDCLRLSDSHPDEADFSAERRLVHDVFLLDAEICNGGLEQYFVNSSGDDWHSALAGLRTIRLAAAAAVVTEATALFGKDGPSSDRETRQKQLAKLVRRDEHLFDALNKRYYKSAEGLRVQLMRFILQHRDAFALE